MSRTRRSRMSLPPVAELNRLVSVGATYAALDYHAHCVLCGMMASIERLQQAPHDVDAYVHYYGGSIKQHWEEYPPLREDALQLMLSRMEGATAYLRAELGLPARAAGPSAELGGRTLDVDEDEDEGEFGDEYKDQDEDEYDLGDEYKDQDEDEYDLGDE